MISQKPPSRRHFTEAARAAAIEGRRRKQLAAPPKDFPQVFVVRLPCPRLAYGWEIRRFGAVVLAKGHAEHPTMVTARTAGEQALASLSVGA